jgi:glycosyltransferase involved in cell wall biosynthesis
MKIVVATTYATHPPTSGAALRNFHLYGEIAKRHPVRIVALVKQDAGALEAEIAPGLFEQRIPISDDHLWEELRLCEKADGNQVGDFAVSHLFRLTPAYVEALKAACDEADVIVASHPNLIYAICQVSGKPLVYEAPDVEIDLRRSHLPSTAETERMLVRIEQTEAHCLAEADLVLACSDEDLERFARHYGVSRDKLRVAENGVEPWPFDPSRFARPASRLRCLFLASWAPPNVEGARRVLDLAAATPEHDFVIAGSVCRAPELERASPPTNVRFVGELSHDAKRAELEAADLALNPVVGGSGSNIKIREYVAAGLPVVSTAFGARGLPDTVRACLDLAKAEAFGPALASLAARDPAERRRRAEIASEDLLAALSWTRVGARAAADIEAMAKSREAPSADRIAVVIPMYNAEPYIEEAVRSALDQTHGDLEVLVVDDGSTDASASIVEALAREDARVRLLRHGGGKNRGVSRAIELGVRSARAPFIALLDADDAFEPDKLRLQLEALRRHPEAVLCHTGSTVVSEADPALAESAGAYFNHAPSAPFYDPMAEPAVFTRMTVLTSSALVRTEVFKHAPFSGEQIWQNEDYLLVTLFASRGWFVHLPERLTRYRIHPASFTARQLTSPLRHVHAILEGVLMLAVRLEGEELRARAGKHVQDAVDLLRSHYQDDALRDPPPLPPPAEPLPPPPSLARRVATRLALIGRLMLPLPYRPPAA